MKSKLIHATKHTPCPICKNTDWCYELSDSLWVCKRSDFAPDGWRKTSKQDSAGHFLFAIEGDDPEWQEKKAQWDANRLEREENQRLANLEKRKGSLTATERDPLIRAMSKDLGLSREHREMLLDRGLTEAQIDEGLFFSIEKWQKVSSDYPLNLPGVSLSKFNDRYLNGQGIAIVTFDVDRLATGWQILAVPRIEGAPKYPWAKGAKSSHLPVGNGIGELPIQVVGAPGKKKIAYLAEGTLKPRIAGCRHDEYFIGASSGNFSGSPVQLKAVLEGIKTVVITLDSGDVTNPARMFHWQRQYEFLVLLGVKVKFLWWSQFKKEKNDIDEISTKQFRSARLIDLNYFLKLPGKAAQAATDKLLFAGQSSLSLKVTYNRSEEYLSDIPTPKQGFFTFISSPCGTGKTEQLSQIIDRWQQLFSESKIVFPGYRNGLLDQTRNRLRIPNYRVGYGQDDAAINNYQKVAICLDSLLKLKLESIPFNTLLILDEFEAILKHGTQSSTLGSKRAAVQSHFVEIVDRVLSTGGAVVCLEDSLTDLSINGILDLLDRKYSFEILENTLEKFHWDVKMCGGSASHYIGLILDRLKRGQNLIVPSTSQAFIEAVERIAIAAMPELANKIVRLDAKTAPHLHDLLTDPDAWLAANPIRLMLLSPTVESGFSIKVNSNKHWFDREMAYFTNLDTRCHVQLLCRDRSDIPRDIFVLEKGAEAGSARGRDPIALMRMRKAVANGTSLLHGAGRIPMGAQGAVWNRLDAEFSTRSALSSKYMAEYLADELVARGHNVQQVDWEEVRAQEQAEYNIEDAISSKELSVVYKETKQAILVESNKILADSNGKELTPDRARAILHSSSSTYEQRQQAHKCLLHERLPGVDLNENFLMAVHTENRGAYLQQCDLSWFLKHPELAKYIERSIFANQIQQPHVLYSQTPKFVQRIELLLPIAEFINDLATGREYMASDPAVDATCRYALKHSNRFFNLFNLTIREESALGKGNGAGSTQNSLIATLHKIMKQLGYIPKLMRRVGKAGAQERVYAIENFDCLHRQEVYKALDYKHRAYLTDGSSLEPIALVFNTNPDIKSEAINSTSLIDSKPMSPEELDNMRSATDILGRIANVPVADEIEAIELLKHFQSEWTVEFLTLVTNNLTPMQRISLKKLIFELDSTRLAS